MARPAEKARNMLNKWVAMREAGNDVVKPKGLRRPHLASECDNLGDAERFRGQIVRQITSKIAKIQNPALPENQVRDLNDRINRWQREKYHWNKRIYELGGLDFNAIERKRQIEEGDKQLHLAYRYYGVAKDLPGVREHLEKEEKARTKAKRSDIHKHITPDYFGWRDEEDGVLLELEEAATAKMLAMTNRRPTPPDASGEDFLEVASQEEIAEILLEQKKKVILAKYSL